MKKRTLVLRLSALLLLQLFLLLPLFAGDYIVSDIALTPGKDIQHLNLAWHTEDDTGGCVVEIMEKHNYNHNKTKKYYRHKHLKNFSRKFYGTKQNAGPDENNIDTYACEAIVSGLKESSEYLYRLGDNNGNWTQYHEYATRDPEQYGFIYLADSQIGSSRDVDADTAGWVETLEIIGSQFPDTAFILSAGDQVEKPGEEDQWTGFFSATELQSLPLAPAIGSHDDFPNGRGGSIEDTLPNMDYHFNLPNESTTYGVSAAGGDYYYVYGETLFMVLNVDPALAGDSDCSDHEVFMKEAIAANPHVKWKFVTWHNSIYSAGSHATDNSILMLREAMVPIIDELDIDVVFMGHDHSFARSYQMLGDEPQTEQTVNKYGEIINPTGTLYLTANSSSGSKYYNLHRGIDSFDYLAEYSQLKVPSFSSVTVDKNRLSIVTYRTDTMEIIDSYTLIKKKRHRHHPGHHYSYHHKKK